jgi:hypothetical protein
MSQKPNKVGLTNLEESVIAALSKLAPDAILPFGGKPVASKDLQTQLQAHLAAMKSVDDAHAKFSQLVSIEQSQRADIGPVLTGIRSYAAGLYGEKSPEFASFGFKPTITPARTVASKAAAVEKQLATRVARHTMGKRQRAAIHGVVPTNPPPNAPVVTPPTSGAPVASQPLTTAPVAMVTNGVSH